MHRRLYGPGGTPDRTFQIPGAGVFSDSAVGLGYVSRIRAIDDHIYVCGQSRQVWQFEFNGNDLAAGELSGKENTQTFTGAAWFDGSLFLAAPEGLYRYDAETQRIDACTTGLTPELQDAHRLEAKNGVLWSFGFKDLAWFDGKQWTRVDHPDNPPIT